MLLLLTLLPQSEDEGKRVLIDSLLELEMRSAASISRAAGVSPASLSNLRRPEGIGQISSEGQDRVLAELGWPGTKLNPSASLRWPLAPWRRALRLSPGATTCAPSLLSCNHPW